MPPGAEYQERISRFGWKELSGLWEEIKSGSTPGWPDGKALEYLGLRAFQLGGAVVCWPYEVRLWDESEIVEQIDGAIHGRGLHCLIESKDWGKNVNIEPVAKLRDKLLRRPAGTIGVVFSRGDFTSAAVKLAQFAVHEGVLLWTGREIGYALRSENILDALDVKYRVCVEQANPYFNVAVEEVP
jgi:hypothetical protein